MAFVADIRKTVIDTTPVLAAVGLTDLAVEKVRDAGAKAAAVRIDLDATTLQTKAQARVTEAAEQAQTQARAQVRAVRTQAETVVEQAQELPALALNRTLELAGKAQETYETVAARGEKLVKRVRTQKSTKDLLAQAEATFALGKGAVTTVRKSATEIQRSAKATLTTGRKEAAVAVDAIADSIADEATEATTAVKQSATRTSTAAKRTATTTKNAAAKSKSATKGATTSAKKTATATKKASTTAATKVGD
jgi:heparin binding hemagglutinin HbhA